MVVAILIAIISVMIRYYFEGMKCKYSYLKQILDGLIKLIAPLCILLLIVIWLKDDIENFREVLIVLISCETIAIFLNPFPKWCFENNIEGIGEIVDKVWRKKS